MAELEVLQKCNPLLHTYVAINLEAHVSNGISRVYISNDILCDYIQAWHLQEPIQSIILTRHQR